MFNEHRSTLWPARRSANCNSSCRRHVDRKLAHCRPDGGACIGQLCRQFQSVRTFKRWHDFWWNRFCVRSWRNLVVQHRFNEPVARCRCKAGSRRAPTERIPLLRFRTQHLTATPFRKDAQVSICDHDTCREHQQVRPKKSGTQRAPDEIRTRDGQSQPNTDLTPACIAAACAALRNRHAMVIGPTPPGTGVMAPATLAQSS